MSSQTWPDTRSASSWANENPRLRHLWDRRRTWPFAAGVTVGGLSGLAASLVDPIAVGVIVGLVVGKTVGVLGASYAVARLTKAELDDELTWLDVLGLALLTGVGFTVSLLIGELAFDAGSPRDDIVKVAVLTGSLLAASFAGVILRIRNSVYRRIEEGEIIDADADGIPDRCAQR
jgi:Na+:H+ antiporter, NhaA family